MTYTYTSYYYNTWTNNVYVCCMCMWFMCISAWVYGDDDDNAGGTRVRELFPFYFFVLPSSIHPHPFPVRDSFCFSAQRKQTSVGTRDRVCPKHQRRLQGQFVLGWVRLVNRINLYNFIIHTSATTILYLTLVHIIYLVYNVFYKFLNIGIRP